MRFVVLAVNKQCFLARVVLVELVIHTIRIKMKLLGNVNVVINTLQKALLENIVEHKLLGRCLWITVRGVMLSGFRGEKVFTTETTKEK